MNIDDLIQLIILVVLIGTAALGRFLTRKPTPGGGAEDEVGEGLRKLARKIAEMQGGKPFVASRPEDMTEEEQEVILFGKPPTPEQKAGEIRLDTQSQQPASPAKTWVAPEVAVREFLEEQAEEKKESRGLTQPVAISPQPDLLKRRRDYAPPAEGFHTEMKLLTPEMFHDHAQLQRAIVLMEILGKPLGDRP